MSKPICEYIQQKLTHVVEDGCGPSQEIQRGLELCYDMLTLMITYADQKQDLMLYVTHIADLVRIPLSCDQLLVLKSMLAGWFFECAYRHPNWNPLLKEFMTVRNCIQELLLIE